MPIEYCKCHKPVVYLDIEDYDSPPRKYCLECDLRIKEDLES